MRPLTPKQIVCLSSVSLKTPIWAFLYDDYLYILESSFKIRLKTSINHHNSNQLFIFFTSAIKRELQICQKQHIYGTVNANCFLLIPLPNWVIVKGYQ